MKLTKQQISLLRALHERPHYVAEFYGPFKVLKKLGLIEERDGRYSTIAYVTESGEAVLASQIPERMQEGNK